MNGPIVMRGDARALPFPNESVDLIVTSPPYFGLRSYTDGGEHYATQVGAEATPREFIAALIECTRDMVRVLKPSGSIFVNLGDKYSGYNAGSGKGRSLGGERGEARMRDSAGDPHSYGVPNKSLMLLPERYRIACVDELGLIVRAVIVWDKPNGLPESVRDRVRRSHEDWVHLTKSPRYFEAVDEIREPLAPPAGGRVARPLGTRNMTPRHTAATDTVGWKDHEVVPHALGKLPGSVWTIPTQPLRVPAELEVDHFAAFPMEWPRRLITGWCPREVCSACGEGRRPVRETLTAAQDVRGRPTLEAEGRTRRLGATSSLRSRPGGEATHTITGYACACPDTSAPSTPGVVLDPFGGTGTTALVADVLGRVGISLDASADYCRLARWRTTDERERATAAGNDRATVAAPTESAPSLFDLEAS